jgi:predicted AAA+ superfamily ATPase
MPHLRERYLSAWIGRLIKGTPALALVGMRQTGKTTLLEDLAKTVYRFDKESNVLSFQRESTSLLRQGPFPILLDEVQKAPFVFDEVKAQIDERKIPGRYLMTGSVRFSSKKNIRESMTGRVLTLELLPLGLAESHQRPLSDAISSIVDKIQKAETLIEALGNRSWATVKILNHYLDAGGLPGICFQRDKLIRKEAMDNHLDTLLSRDLGQFYQSKLSPAKLRDFLKLIARSCGQPINKSQIARELATTAPTVAAHLNAFESLFLIRGHAQGYYFEDQGLASHICRFESFTDLSNLRRSVFSELQVQLHYRFRSDCELTQYSSTSGNTIPFVLKHISGLVLAFILDEGDRPSNSSLKVATWFQKKHGANSGCIILHSGSQSSIIGDKIIAIPYLWIF